MAAASSSMESQVSKLKAIIDGEYGPVKDEIRAFLRNNDLFKMKYDLSMDEHRAITLERAKSLFRLPAVQGGFDDIVINNAGHINKGLAIGEIGSSTDSSIGIKLGVMVWLFGGAILNLGTEDQILKWYRPLKGLQYTGMFAMSELSHGSNVRGIETEAHYDKNTQEFVINSPSPDSYKMYIGNALNGDFAAVFAQLYVDDDCKGPHCFVVPIRDERGVLQAGVTVSDLGPKGGLNGVDNGILSFNNIRIPRNNLLNRFGDVSPDGIYSSTIKNDDARFNAMLAALVGCRLAVCYQALASTKIGLEIAIKYSTRRRQFGKKNQPEEIIMDYLTHQLRLMPHLATSLALTFSIRYAGNILSEEIYAKRPLVENRKFQALAAGLKAYATWDCISALQACRECTGGMGFMEVNRLCSLKRDADIFTTFEGDNMVMLQQVTKELLIDYAKRFKNSKMQGVVSVWADDIGDALKTRFAISSMPLCSVEYAIQALSFKESRLLRMLGKRLKSKVDNEGMEPFDAWNQCLDHSIELGWCYVKRVTLEQFKLVVDSCTDQETKSILDKFLLLHAIDIMYNERVWFLEANYLTKSESKLLRDKMLELCKETRQHALSIIKAFDHPDVCVGAPIAGYYDESAPWAYFPELNNEEKVKSKL
ncbi:acyl-coenzyme A oxidase-like protein isoform X2 [Tubulanus polymorphus]|uniref:acyl-coenzyme A oxidase-like protein isoform X2 n=1 Tax=Tubulanus polymorphus TaxID=672921 RepID=UPI003DA33A45